jgi:type VI secretion system secreted protein VgrG
MTISSETRICTVHSPLGDDALLLHELSAQEAVSGLFQFNARFTSTNLEIDFSEILGQNISIEAQLADGDPRFFSGVVSRFSQQNDDASNNVYYAEIVPWLWLTKRSSNCRIFQDKTVIEVIELVFGELNFSDYRLETGSYERIPYCVQYRETDFNFVSRLMEAAGIAYYFEHALDLHTMVLFDSPSANPDCPGQAEATYASAEGDEDMPGRVLGWHVERQLRSGTWSHTDYNYTDPSLDLSTQKTVQDSVDTSSRLELYDYPGEYESLGVGEDIASLRVEAEEIASHFIEGDSTCPGFCPGYKFALAGHYRPSFDETYLLTDVHHSITQPVGNTGGTSSYSNSFRCTPHALPYRPPRRAKKPVVQGMQPALVVSTEGKDIDVDEYGRVLVRFPWDRAENGASCRVRVSQNWAGKKWGGMFFPHTGQEVLVCFLEGDPDRPFVSGRVYNAENMPPQDPAANATKSIIRDHGGNEMVMDGEAGNERITLKTPCGTTQFSMGAPHNPEFPGLFWQTESYGWSEYGSDLWQYVGGNDESDVNGNKILHVGQETTYLYDGRVQAKWDGVYNKTHGGLVSDVFIGGKHSMLIGAQLTTNVALLIERSIAKTIKKVEGKVLVDSQVETKIVGGGGKSDTSRHVLNEAHNANHCGESYISIMKDSDIWIVAEGNNVTIETKGDDVDIKAAKNVTIKAKKVIFDCDEIDFGKATLNGGKMGTIFD